MMYTVREDDLHEDGVEQILTYPSGIGAAPATLTFQRLARIDQSRMFTHQLEGLHLAHVAQLRVDIDAPVINGVEYESITFAIWCQHPAGDFKAVTPHWTGESEIYTKRAGDLPVAVAADVQAEACRQELIEAMNLETMERGCFRREVKLLLGYGLAEEVREIRDRMLTAGESLTRLGAVTFEARNVARVILGESREPGDGRLVPLRGAPENHRDPGVDWAQLRLNYSVKYRTLAAAFKSDLEDLGGNLRGLPKLGEEVHPEFWERYEPDGELVPLWATPEDRAENHPDPAPE